MRATLLKVTIALLVVVGSACSDDDDGDAAATTTTAPSETTTTALPSDPTTTTTIAVELGEEPSFHEDGASGSGCTPGDDTGLPDGWWYGEVDSEVTDAVSFDLACYYVGAAADETAASRGEDAPSGVYVVNDNLNLRSIPLADDVQTTCVTLEPEVANVDCAPGDLSGDFGVWIRVFGGEADRIVEQYHP